LLLVRLTELLNLKRLGTHLPLTTPAKSVSAVGTCAILFISAVGGPGDGGSALIRRFFKHPTSRFRIRNNADVAHPIRAVPPLPRSAQEAAPILKVEAHLMCQG